MYILGYLYTPHRANNRRKTFVCHCICGTCWWRALSKTNSCTAKQHGLAPVSEVRGLFLVEESGRGGRGRNKRYSLYTAGRWLLVLFLPTFSWTPSRYSFTFLTFLPLLLPVALTFSTGCEGNDTKALQTRNIPNCWFTKFKHLNFKNSYLLFICGTVS